MTEIHQQDIDRLIMAIENISHGRSNQPPMGLEAVAMCISGSPLREDSLTDGLLAIASSIRDLAEAVREK